MSKSLNSYTFSGALINTPNLHQFADYNWSTVNNSLELQIYFDAIPFDNGTVPEYNHAALSFIFTSDNISQYMIDGTQMLEPFFGYGDTSLTTNGINVDINFGSAFYEVSEYYHQWFTYSGRSTQDCSKLTTWYVNA